MLFRSEGKDQRLEEVEEIEFGPLLTDKQEVEPMLRRAQAAVLRPGVDSSKFVNMTDADLQSKDKKSLRFSRNVVCVELTGPDLADLSFVDLPGIVQNADAEIVNLIEDLVNSYIKGNSLILVTMPMSGTYLIIASGRHSSDVRTQTTLRTKRLQGSHNLQTPLDHGQ